MLGYCDFFSFKQICDTLRANDWTYTVDCINMALFNVPQSRHRLILRATRNINNHIVAPFVADQGTSTWYTAIVDLLPSFKRYNATNRVLTRAAMFNLDPEQFYLINIKENRNSQIARKSNQPAWTITTHSHLCVVHQHTWYQCSLAALMRLQTVPDTYIHATRKIIGNGIPPNFAEYLMRTFL